MRISWFRNSGLAKGLFPLLVPVFVPVLVPVLALGLAGPAPATPASSITSAEGVAAPTLAFNLVPPTRWETNIPFIDLMKTSGTFRTDGSERLDDTYLDENGWPTVIPEGTTKLRSDFRHKGSAAAGPSVKPGRYIMSFEGEGVLRIRGAKVVAQSETQIEFDYPKPGNLFLEILATDPQKTGNHLRNISLIHEDHIALHEAGGLFNPDWIKIVADAGQLRFMDWMRTNNSSVSEWSDLVSPGYASWARKGVPLEVMVALANQTGADPWFTMPHLATDDFVRNFATYVRDHLDPALVVTVEYSNETWNNGFKHTQWMHDKAKEVFKDDKAWSHDYYAKRATEIALIWKEVFGPAAENRLVATLATHTNNPKIAARILKARMWQNTDPANFVAPETVFDALAVTTYFGNTLLRRDDARDALIAAIKDPSTDAEQYAYDLLATGTDHNTTEKLRGIWAEQAKHAQTAGLKLVAYEGGQHVQHHFRAKIPKQDVDILTEFMVGFIRSEHMAALYQANWDAWKEVSDGPYMHYSDVGAPSKWGSWGLLASLTDSTPRSTYAFERNASEEPWWDDPRSGAQALQGRTLFAAAAGETLLGTVQEDFLIGAAGPDTLVGGPGDDGLHGGGGQDRVVLTGAPEDYTIAAEGAGWRLEGPDGSDFLIAVEILAFDAGPVLDLAEFAASRSN